MALDEEYGETRMPQKIDSWEFKRAPSSKCILDVNLAKQLKDLRAVSSSKLFRNAAKSLTYIWAMDADGELHIAVEELAEMPDGTRVEGYPRRRNFPTHPADEKKLGHPTLLAGGLARIC